MSERTQRRLAAIVSVDVVAYSRLMGADEAGTLLALRAHRNELIDPKIAEHGGRIVKVMGDGLLLEFPSVVEAVQCGTEIQEAMAARNVGVLADKRIVLRIGVNQGDIIVDGDDILGDGVNVAARLQAIADPGGVAISVRVHDDIRDRLDAMFEDAGPLELKNIARPVGVWHWRSDAAGDGEPPRPAEPSSIRKPAIAVLPFANMSNDPDQDYFAEGIAEDVITALSRFRALLVIARNSTFTFKGDAVNVRNVCRTLGARYVVEGSVRKAGDRVRVTAKLIDGDNETHLWAERYDRTLDDVFAVQDDIANAIVAGVAPQSLDAEMRRASRLNEAELGAWDLVMRARWQMGQFTKAGHGTARDLLNQALELDPQSGHAHSLLALNCLWSIPYSWAESVAEAQETAARAARRAVSLDADDAVAHAVLGMLFAYEKRYDDAVSSCRRAVALNPNLALAHGLLCVVSGLADDYDAVSAVLENALRLSPRDPDRPLWIAGAGMAAYKAERYEDVVRLGDLAIAANPNVPTAYRQRAAGLAMLGRVDDAKRDIARLLGLVPGNTIATVRRQLPYPADAMEQFVEGLSRAGLPE